MLVQTQSKLFISWLVVFMFAASSLGCASYGGPEPLSAHKEEIAAKMFKLKENKASIYVYRNGLNSDIRMPISLNGKLIAKTTSKTFLKLTVEPGFHEISSEEGNFSSIALKTQAGENYYVFQEIITDDDSIGANLQVVDEFEGQRGVQECRLIATSQLGQVDQDQMDQMDQLGRVEQQVDPLDY